MNEESLLQIEWDFSKVPDEELMACCFWEYGRESAFVRSVRQHCLENWRAGGNWNLKLNEELRTLEGIGYPSEVFIRGFFFEPGAKHKRQNGKPPKGKSPDALAITGSFPKPWQTLSVEERACRAHIGSDRERIPLVPLHRGYSLEAKDIADWAASRRSAIDSANQQVLRENPGQSESELLRLGKLKTVRIEPSLYYESGREITVVSIQWGDFTNDEIATYFRKWVKANRPHFISGPNGRGHNKARDLRVPLERLGMMRLLGRFRLRDMADKVPEAWKLYGKREWYKERKRASDMFHRFFPVLPKEERPLSWPTKGGRSK